jgi:hypothetical protein
MLQLLYHRGWRMHLSEQLGEYADRVDEQEIVEGRSIGDNDHRPINS